ncbi:cyclin-like protein [Pilatotrama ljubarskyi]|nr:cyclin-like protein [Pilatotrama ljubarskyi]
MATVSGPSTARHPSPFRRQNKIAAPRPPGAHPPPADPYYGHEETAKLCARFVTHLFACPDLPPLSTAVPPAPAPPLANFIAYALHRTRLHTSVTFAALYLLQRLKARFPAARGSSGHRLFISAFMIASKVICDDTYSNKSWSIVGQGMFALREINQMEREMCSYLEWQLNIDPSALQEFEQKVRRDFKGPGPYPTYVVSSPAPSPVPSTTPYAAQANGGNAPPPSFTTRPTQAPSTSPPKPIPPPVPVHAGNPYGPGGAPPSAGSSTTLGSTTTASSAPNTPDTPESSMSTSTSPASSAPPSTPLGYEDHNVRVVGQGMLGTPNAINSASPSGASPAAPPAPAPAFARPTPQARGTTGAAGPGATKKATCGEIFARAAPCVW